MPHPQGRKGRSVMAGKAREPDSAELVHQVRTARDALDTLLAYVGRQPKIPNLIVPTGCKATRAFQLRERGPSEDVHYAIGLRLVEGGRVEVITSWFSEGPDSAAKGLVRELVRLGFKRARGGSWIATLDAKDELGIDRAMRVATRAMRACSPWEGGSDE